jgi:hypothetical protein
MLSSLKIEILPSETSVLTNPKRHHIPEEGILHGLLTLFLARGSLPLEDGGDAFSETSVLTRATRCHFPGDAIVLIHRCENFRRYKRICDYTVKCPNVIRFKYKHIYITAIGF